MPLLAVPLMLPPDVVEVRVGDVDLDGEDEVVWVSRPVVSGVAAAPVTLTVVHLEAGGQESDRWTVPLGASAVLWDLHGGLWGVDAEGALNLLDGERVGAAPTPLAALGPTTPLAADVVDDLDGDGVAEVLVPSRGQVRVFSVDGRERGTLRASPSGALSSHTASGGSALVVATHLAPMVVGDVDGDGRRDVLLPAGKTATAWLTAADGTVGGAGAMRRLALPLDLDPPPQPGRAGERLVSSWLVDLDGDGRLDLATHQEISDGGWLGTTAKLSVWAGTGTGFVPRWERRTTRAAVMVRLLDFDSDGDQDILVAEVDLGLGNLSRALLARAVQVEVGLYECGAGGRYASTPRPLRSLSWPLDEQSTLLLDLHGDLDGDGWLDLVTNDGGSELRVYAGGPGPFPDTPLARISVAAPRPGDALLVQDLTGDGRAEVVLWHQREARATLYSLAK